VLGPMPCPHPPYTNTPIGTIDITIGFNVTYEADCSIMNGLAQGTRISMWNPQGPAYNPGGCNGAPLRYPVAGVPRQANWIHYDVPMDQTCTWTSGIQSQRCRARRTARGSPTVASARRGAIADGTQARSRARASTSTMVLPP